MAAIEIFIIYERLYGVVQTGAYSLLLMSYVSCRENISNIKTPKLDSIITFLINSNIDLSIVLSNLILQFYCYKNDIDNGGIYLNRMRTLRHRPSTNALLSYVELVVKYRGYKNYSRVIDLFSFMFQEEFVVSFPLIQLCLERCVG